MEFKVNGRGVGEQSSQVQLPGPATVHVTALASALLDEKPDPAIKNRPYEEKPYWHVERARIGETREVPVESFCTAPGRTVLGPGEFLVSLRLPPPIQSEEPDAGLSATTTAARGTDRGR